MHSLILAVLSGWFTNDVILSQMREQAEIAIWIPVDAIIFMLTIKMALLLRMRSRKYATYEQAKVVLVNKIDSPEDYCMIFFMIFMNLTLESQSLFLQQICRI